MSKEMTLLQGSGIKGLRFSGSGVRVLRFRAVKQDCSHSQSLFRNVWTEFAKVDR